MAEFNAAAPPMTARIGIKLARCGWNAVSCSLGQFPPSVS
jgi:hypothetical protein